MIRTLIRRDPAFDNPVALVIAPIAVGLLVRLVSLAEELPPALTDLSNSGGRSAIMGGLFAFLFAVVMGAKVWIRCPQLIHGLPVSGRTIWMVRTLAITSVCAVVIVLFSLTIALELVDGRPSLRGDVLFGGLRILSLLWLFVLMLQSPWPARRRLDMTAGMIVYTGLSWVLMVVAVALAPYNWITPTVAVLLSAVLAARIRRLTPPIHELEVETPDAAAPDAAVPTAATSPAMPRHRPSRWLLHRTLLLQMHRHWVNMLYIPMILLYGLSVAPRYCRGESSLMMLLYGLLFGLTVVVQAILRMHPLDPLPVSRRTLFAHATLPVLLTLALGIGGGGLIVASWDTPPSVLQVRAGSYETPHEFLEIAPADAVPTYTFPDGRTITPEGRSLRPWSAQVLYDPYAANGPDITPSQARRQLSRALEAVYGRPVDDPRLAWTDTPLDSLPLADPFRGERSEPRDRTLGLLAVLTVLYLTWAIRSGLGLYDARRTERSRKIRGFTLIAGPLIIVPVLMLIDALGGADMWVSAAAGLVQLRRFTAWAPLSAEAWWGLAALLSVAGYLVIEKRFAGIEATLDLVKKQKAENF